MVLLFIYGTLKNGHVRHGVMRNERYIGIAKTMPKYSIYQYGNYPALINDDKGCQIYGELYEVGDSCLIELDKIEGTDHGLFQRKEIDLDEVILSNLPVSENVWIGVANKKAITYFFQKTDSLNGARNCGAIWTIK